MFAIWLLIGEEDSCHVPDDSTKEAVSRSLYEVNKHGFQAECASVSQEIMLTLMTFNTVANFFVS